MPRKMLERSDDGVRFTIMLGFGHRLAAPFLFSPAVSQLFPLLVARQVSAYAMSC